MIKLKQEKDFFAQLFTNHLVELTETFLERALLAQRTQSQVLEGKGNIIKNINYVGFLLECLRF